MLQEKAAHVQIIAVFKLRQLLFSRPPRCRVRSRVAHLLKMAELVFGEGRHRKANDDGLVLANGEVLGRSVCPVLLLSNLT